MQDDRAARLLVGRIAGLDIESLELRPQELATPRDASPRDNGAAVQPPIALFRMDFAARVRTPDGGERQVLIEIQKTNAPTVVERFRAYLGQQLCSPANVVEHPSGRREAVPIVTIYLLGYDLGLSDEAVLDVCPRATERRTGAEIDGGHPFIAGIHHRSHIVQIPRLRGRRRGESRRADRAERALSQALSRSIRQLHRLGQEPDAIARALSMDEGTSTAERWTTRRRPRPANGRCRCAAMAARG